MNIYNFGKPDKNGMITMRAKVKTLTSRDTIKVRAKVQTLSLENDTIKVKVIRRDEIVSECGLPMEKGNPNRIKKVPKNP